MERFAQLQRTCIAENSFNSPNCVQAKKNLCNTHGHNIFYVSIDCFVRLIARAQRLS